MSPSREAFQGWWREGYNSVPGWIDKIPTEESMARAEAAFQAGVNYALEVTGKTKRSGDLRGRVITCFRTLNADELAQVNPKLRPLTVWPCLELDDGTLVYSGRYLHYSGPGQKVPDAFHGPTQLLGQRRTPDGEIQIVRFEVEVHDFKVKPEEDP